MSKELTLPEHYLLAPRHFGFIDPFTHLDTGRWTTIASDGGSAAVVDAAGGILRLTTSDATPADNDEVYVHTANEVFLFADDKPGEAVGRVKWAEANVDDANVIFGLWDGVTANDLQDNAGGPPASYSGAVFFKLDGETQWRFETSLAGVQTTTLLAAVSPNGANDWHSLKIVWRLRDSTHVEIVPWIDENGGQDFHIALDDANGKPVKHIITLGLPTEMALAFGAKAGGANEETADFDYAGAFQLL